MNLGQSFGTHILLGHICSKLKFQELYFCCEKKLTIKIYLINLINETTKIPEKGNYNVMDIKNNSK